jgi:DNA-binding SARP family transcriptional activator
VRQAAIALDELRLTAIEDRIEADLALGGRADLIPELSVLTEEHPYRERLRGQLMTAPARAGRSAEALRSYLRTRDLLVEELGIEPSVRLQQLHRAILMGVTEAAEDDVGPGRPAVGGNEDRDDGRDALGA